MFLESEKYFVAIGDDRVVYIELEVGKSCKATGFELQKKLYQPNDRKTSVQKYICRRLGAKKTGHGAPPPPSRGVPPHPGRRHVQLLIASCFHFLSWFSVCTIGVLFVSVDQLLNNIIMYRSVHVLLLGGSKIRTQKVQPWWYCAHAKLDKYLLKLLPIFDVFHAMLTRLL